MKNFKRIACFAFILVMLLTVCCGCGSEKNESEESGSGENGNKLSVLPEVAEEMDLDSKWQNDLVSALNDLKEEHDKLEENGEYIDFCKYTYDLLYPLVDVELEDERAELQNRFNNYDEYTGKYSKDDLGNLYMGTDIPTLFLCSPEMLALTTAEKGEYSMAVMAINEAAEVFCGVDNFLTKIE